MTLDPGNRVYNVDNLNNGFYHVRLSCRQVFINCILKVFRITCRISLDGQLRWQDRSVLADISLLFDTTMVPLLSVNITR
ncbi:MAG: hypothetical protein MZV63_20060 [Marinilabiliales bacterium]|nr:hypothetical protein [Marinilabiliales bacterium]